MEHKELQNINKIDMLNGSLWDKIILFALPIAISSILQQLFNAVDVAVVGRFASSQAQAAVGCNGPVINLLINLFAGISVGANVVISNYIGQKRVEGVKEAVHTALVAAIGGGVFVMLFGMLIARPVLVLMDTPKDVVEQAVLYLRIYLAGMPFIMVYNFGAAILRCVGDTKRPLYCLIMSGFINAGLNMFLVIVLHMGVEGVAIATVVSNVISSIMVWRFLAHEEEPLRLEWRKLSIAGVEFRRILRIGVPAGLQGMVFSIANTFIQAALNGYGSDAVAGSAVALNYEYFVFFVVSAFGQTVVTFTSQNYGAGKYDRCRKVFRLSMVSSVLLTVVMSIVFWLGRGFFLSLFTTEPAVIKYASVRMTYILLLNWLINSYEISGAALRGMGYSMTPAILTVFGTCVFRLVWIYTVCRIHPGYHILLMVYPITWVITGTAVLVAYFLRRKKAFTS